MSCLKGLPFCLNAFISFYISNNNNKSSTLSYCLNRLHRSAYDIINHYSTGTEASSFFLVKIRYCREVCCGFFVAPSMWWIQYLHIIQSLNTFCQTAYGLKWPSRAYFFSYCDHVLIFLNRAALWISRQSEEVTFQIKCLQEWSWFDIVLSSALLLLTFQQ